MQQSKVVTHIWWHPGQGFDARASTTFSDATKIRLDPQDHKIKLKLDSDFLYPTDANLHIRSRTYNPGAIRQLLKLQVNATIPTDDAGAALGSVGLRLYDGTDERYWDGGAWAVAGASDWNTEAVVNANLSSFNVATSRQFAVVLNLVTTDSKVTPEVESVHVAWQGPVDWHDDILLDSLVGMLQSELTYIADAALPPVSGSTGSLDLDDYFTNTTINVANLDAVFDDVNDPNHLTDLLSSYNTGTRVATLSAPIPTSGVPFLRLVVTPQVAWDTHQDFTEVGLLPQLVLRESRAVRSSKYPEWARTGTVRKDDGTAIEVPPPYRITYEIEAELRTDRSREQHRFQESFNRLFTVGPSGSVGPFLRSVATDRYYRLWLVDEFRVTNPMEDESDLKVHRVTFRLEDVALELEPAIDAYAVLNLNTGYAAIRSIDEKKSDADGSPVPTTTLETIVVS